MTDLTPTSLRHLARFKKVGVLILDTEGQVQWANTGFERISGFTLNEVKGQRPADFLTCDSTSVEAAASIARATRERVAFSGIMANKTKQGHTHWVDIEFQPMFSSTGDHVGFMELQKDVTQFKQLNAELQQRQTGIEMLSRSANVGEWSMNLVTREVTWSDQVRRIHEVGLDYRPSFETAIAFYPEDVRDILQEGLKACVETRSAWDMELPFVTAKGRHRTVRVFASPVVEKDVVTRIAGAFRDVTETVAIRNDLAVSRERLEMATEAAQIGLWEWNIAENLFWTNAGWWSSLGFSAHQPPVPDELADLRIHPEDMPRVRVNRAAFLSGERPVLDHEFRHIDSNNEWRWINSVGRPTATDEQGRVTRAAGVYIDIHERKLANDRVRHAACHDALTGLINREEAKRVVSDLSAAALALQEGKNDGFCFILIDLDRFKAVNDTAGHGAGDEVLIEVASRLKQVVRETDHVARLGGDEFAIITTLSENCREMGEQIARRVLKQIDKEFIVHGRPFNLGASIGLAVGPDHGEDFGSLTLHADAALYDVKDNGRNDYRFFDKRIEAKARSRRELESALKHALQRNEFELHYQTQVEIETGKPISVEALLRWRHPTRGYVSPVEFIPVAEDCSLIEPIGTWVIEKACADAASWANPLPIAINLSVGQLGKSDIEKVVARALAQSGLSPSRLEFEVTESVLLEDDKSQLDELHRLRELGVALALDDFGTGYASLFYLKKLPFSKIKIDRSFVADIEHNKQSAAIIATVVNLAHLLDMKITAEGIETQEQATLLSAAGCKLGQGYLFSRPVPQHLLFQTQTHGLRAAAG